jgi:CRP-like cAMP-binding protein
MLKEVALDESPAENIVQMLSQLDLFAGIDDRWQRQVASYIRIRVLQPGQVILVAEQSEQFVYLVVKGEVRVYRLSLEGREYVLAYHYPGHLFNLAALFGEADLSEITEAVGQAVIYAIPCDRFRQIIRADPVLSIAVMEKMAGYVRHLHDRAEDLALYPVRTRLARFLLSLAGSRFDHHKNWTHQEIAAVIGTVRDVVSRELRMLADQGLVRRGRGRLIVVDRVGLRRVAMRKTKGKRGQVESFTP